MNRKALFQNAHQITKATVQPGDNYQITFGASLKALIALSPKVWSKAKARAEEASERMGRVYMTGRGWQSGLINVGVNKSANEYIAVCIKDVADEIMDLAIERRQQAAAVQTRQIAEANAAASKNGRYIALASTADRDGLKRGKSWFCGERDIQIKGALPEWEGEAICYVYP